MTRLPGIKAKKNLCAVFIGLFFGQNKSTLKMIPFGSTFIASNTIPSHLRIGLLLAPGSETSGGSALPDGEIANMPKATANSVKTLPPRGMRCGFITRPVRMSM